MEPFGLPRGSVRALVTLTLCGTVCYLMLVGQPLPTTLDMILAIVLGFYFGRRSQPDRAAEYQPLYLPLGAVRFIILASFIVTATIVGIQGRLFQESVMSVMSLVLGLFIGAVGKYLLSKIDKESGESFLYLIANIKGILVLVATICIAILVITNHYESVDIKWRLTLATFVAFYFGVRA